MLSEVSANSFTIQDPDGIDIHILCWLPQDTPRAVIHLVHGWAEHAARYERIGSELARVGFAAYADDHRGHGQTGINAKGLGNLGPGGMDGAMVGVRAVAVELRERHPQHRIFLLGHSWGSFLAQGFIQRWGSELSGVILTGTTDITNRPVAGDFNSQFEPARTPYDWLSRDESEVDRYIADPWCGFENVRRSGGDSGPTGPTEPTEPTRAILPEARDENIPAGIPVLIMNGSNDPIGGEDGGRALADRYRNLGVRDVTLMVYPQARHELFNEVNRDKVTSDLIFWLESHE